MTTTATTKCEIIRDFASAWNCGLCTSQACATNTDCLDGQTCADGACAGIPTGCSAGVPSAACVVADAANKRMFLFSLQYDPANLVTKNDQVRTLEERDLLTGIQADESLLVGAYPNAPTNELSIGWPDFNRCLWNPSGAPGGPFNNVYFERNDAQSFGMNPVYPIGGTFAQNSIWKYPITSPIPLAVDYVMNPDLATIVIFVLLTVIFAGLILRAAHDTARRRYGRRGRDKYSVASSSPMSVLRGDK